jgi:FHA domain
MEEAQMKVREFKELEDVESFGKLEGPEFKQFIVKYKVYLGRECNSDGAEGLNEEQFIFIGDSQKISRKHALINWNPNKGEWEIEILSKNKAIVNGITLRRGDPPMILESKSAIKIDKYKFYFFPAIPE